jgi:hypothetical protein
MRPALDSVDLVLAGVEADDRQFALDSQFLHGMDDAAPRHGK